MPSYEFQSSDVAATMAKELVECERYANQLRGIDTDRIAFIHAAGKKKPQSLANAATIKPLSPLMRAISGKFVFVVVLFDEWQDWTTAKQYASLLETLLLIKNDGRVSFDDGKLNKYDVLGLNFMVANFGLHWTDSDDVKHPIEDDFTVPGSTTFSGNHGTTRNNEPDAVQGMLDPDNIEDFDKAMDGIPDEI